MRNKKLWSVLISLAIAVIGGMAFCVWVFYFTHTVSVPSAYAVWQTADLVIAYMDLHCGDWPQSWDDLRPIVARGDEGPYVAERGGAVEMGFRPPKDIDRLRELVEVDWSANISILRQAPARVREPPFRVIWLRSGRRTAFEGCEPNQLIKDYVDGRYHVQKP